MRPAARGEMLEPRKQRWMACMALFRNTSPWRRPPAVRRESADEGFLTHVSPELHPVTSGWNSTPHTEKDLGTWLSLRRALAPGLRDAFPYACCYSAWPAQ